MSINKGIKIYKDSASTYEIMFYEDREEDVSKTIGGIFEHDLSKFIRHFFNQ